MGLGYSNPTDVPPKQLARNCSGQLIIAYNWRLGWFQGECLRLTTYQSPTEGTDDEWSYKDEEARGVRKEG